MRRLALVTGAALAAVFAAVFALAAPALAHVTVSAPDATPGGYTVVTFRVPDESAAASTTKLVVQLPPSTPFASVSIAPVPGWTASTTTAKLAKPITNDDGDQLSSAVSTITWTAQAGAAIKPGQFQQFPVELGPLPRQSTVTFRAVQTYSDGSVVRWIETPAPGSTVEPQHPAPTLQLTSSKPAPVGSTKVPSNTGPVVLSIVALVVAAGALGLAVVTRARRRQS
jgi:uncharacterized protein YcnI